MQNNIKKILILLLVIGTLTACAKIKNNVNEVNNETTNETVAENIDNDFFEVLDSVKEIHPGTAGASLKVLNTAYKFLNACRSRLPLDLIAAEWISKQDENIYSSINESFSFVYENLDNFNNDNIKDLLSTVGIEMPSNMSFEEVIEEGKKVLSVVIDKTK